MWDKIKLEGVCVLHGLISLLTTFKFGWKKNMNFFVYNLKLQLIMIGRFSL